MYNENQKPILPVDLSSPEGNIFAIRQMAAELLRKSFFTDQTERIKEMIARIGNASSYEEALAIIGEYVTIRITGGQL